MKSLSTAISSLLFLVAIAPCSLASALIPDASELMARTPTPDSAELVARAPASDLQARQAETPWTVRFWNSDQCLGEPFQEKSGPIGWDSECLSIPSGTKRLTVNATSWGQGVALYYGTTCTGWGYPGNPGTNPAKRSKDLRCLKVNQDGPTSNFYKFFTNPVNIP